MLQKLLDYLSFWFKATNAHGIHSPFAFQLYNEVISANKEYYCFQEIESMRDVLLLDTTVLTINELGAGSQILHGKQRKLREIVKHSVSSPFIAELLFKLVDFFQPMTVIELGTSVGLSTLYLAEAMPTSAKLYTFEGDEGLINIAKANIKTYFQAKKSFPTSKNIEFVLGNIDHTLAKQVGTLEKLDFVFFDANHRKEPTLNYFDICLSKIDENSVFVFDDIYWSAEMKAAWEAIKIHPKVTLSIDLFDIGVVFFREKQPKQTFWLK